MLSGAHRVFLATVPVDFRTSFDRLAGMVRDKLGGDPRSGSFYVFVNKARDRCKVLFYDRTGYCLLYKRLDERSFRGVKGSDSQAARVELDSETFARFLEGVADETRSRKRRAFH